MSDKDLSRYKVINDVCEHRLRRADAAEILNLSERQVQRLMNRLRESGAASLVHGARGKPSNRRYNSFHSQENISSLNALKRSYACCFRIQA
ncbi:helix-turn-helix domain-containing protein [Vibrio diabolicus]|uniref:helix-turn-helix domain-containing protein n=1 Tax=Vibrio diabolicus TaxID=50719 RepID=UPI0035A6791D